MNIRNARGKHKTLQPTAETIWLEVDDGVQYMLESNSFRQHGKPPNPTTCQVAYRREPYRADGPGRLDFYQPWWRVLFLRWGDCEDLSAWRVAYLRAWNVDDNARVGLIEWPTGGWHAIVLRYGQPDSTWSYRLDKLPIGARVYGGPDLGWNPDPGQWYIEDPSYRLGMRDGSQAHSIHLMVGNDQAEPGENYSGDPFRPYGDLSGPPPKISAVRYSAWAGAAQGVSGLSAAIRPPIERFIVRNEFGSVSRAGEKRNGTTFQISGPGHKIMAPESGMLVLVDDAEHGKGIVIRGGSRTHLIGFMGDRAGSKHLNMVSAGDQVGTTGRASLYWQVRREGRYIDPMGLLPLDESENVWRLARAISRTWPTNQQAVALAVALEESEGNHLAISPTGTYRGAWQMVGPDATVFNIEASTRAARALYDERGWQPWDAYNSGRYKNKLSRAIRILGGIQA